VDNAIVMPPTLQATPSVSTAKVGAGSIDYPVEDNPTKTYD